MAALESGYGFTRTAQFANNIFGIKEWVNHDTPTSWQLKGQPDEDGGAVKIIKNYGDDRLVFEENNRRDNRYRKFENFSEAINYLAEITLQRRNYKPALDN
ncbi:MAG: glucosaminidase domain-containing protein, partial [Snowella sp.]